ncbi:putative iSXoo4 transposase [Burkholderia sp. ABCPW 111]|nr:putative iSXoo4 transposase [Burkholderia sp. ABCPW 111]
MPARRRWHRLPNVAFRCFGAASRTPREPPARCRVTIANGSPGDCIRVRPATRSQPGREEHKGLGEVSVEERLAETIEAAKRAKVVKHASLKRLIVDTTVMEKAIAHPTDSRLLERCREHLVKAAARHGLKLRQNDNREASRLAKQIGRYAHAKQYKRMKGALRTLCLRMGRVMRDVERQLDGVARQSRPALEDLIGRTKRILSQKQKDKNKLYALHAPEVECLAKGKARKPYECGVKVSITTTHKEGFVVGARSVPGNPYAGHTLTEALEQPAILGDVQPERRR